MFRGLGFRGLGGLGFWASGFGFKVSGLASFFVRVSVIPQLAHVRFFAVLPVWHFKRQNNRTLSTVRRS